MTIVGTNTHTPITTQQQFATLPDTNQGFPAPVIISVTLPGVHGAVPALVTGPSYDVYPIQQPNGSWTFVGAKGTMTPR